MNRLKTATLAWVTTAALSAGPAFAQDNPTNPVPPPLATPAPAESVTPPPPPPPPRPPRDENHPRRGPEDGRPMRGGPEDGRPMRGGPENGRPMRGGPEDGRPMHGGREEGGSMRDPHHEGMPSDQARHHEPVTFMGVAVGPVPPVLVDQLNLPEGFGLLAEYVVPGGPAEKAGIKTHDVLKSLNDQTLVSPDQLSTLVHSFKEGDSVNVTLVHKGQEAKLTVKLEKQMPPPMMGHEGMEDPHRDRTIFHFKGRRDRDKEDDDDDNADFSIRDDDRPRRGKRDDDDQAPPPPAPPVREILRELRPQIEEIKKAAREEVEKNVRREITIQRERDGASRTTRFDLGRARIVVRDDAGELVLKVDDGHKNLVAKDPEGKVLYSGPVDSPEQRAALPVDVRGRLDKLEREQMPASPTPPTPPAPPVPPAPPAPAR